MLKISGTNFMVILLTAGILLFCKKNTTGNPIVDNTKLQDKPKYTKDGWEISSLKKENIDSVLITDMVKKITSKEYENVHSVVIIKNGKLAFEAYFPGYNANGNYVNYSQDIIHVIASCTKSFTSALIGIAFDKGFLTSLDQKLYDFFPEYHDLQWENSKKRIDLKHMLTMSAGLYWDESTYPFTDSRNSHVQMNASENPVKYALELPVLNEPGIEFKYNSGIAILLGEIIRKKTSYPAYAFAEEYLFEPLGIETYNWYSYPNGAVQTGGGLYLRPRDMAKFGQLFLQEGEWNGNRIISRQWIKESTRMHMDLGSDYGYGYLWWTKKIYKDPIIIESFFAIGSGGQVIHIFPQLEMVVVFTSGNFWEGKNSTSEMLYDHILPAIRIE